MHGGAHRSEKDADSDAVAVVESVTFPRDKACQDGLHDFRQGQPTFDMEFGCVPNLGVTDTVGSEVEGTFVGDPVQRFGCLGYRNGVPERLEIALERTGTGSTCKPGRQRRGSVGRQSAVADLVGKIEDRLRSKTTVEVVMEKNLRCPLDEVEGNRCVGIEIAAHFSPPLPNASR